MNRLIKDCKVLTLIILAALILTAYTAVHADELDDITSMCANANAFASEIVSDDTALQLYYREHELWWSYRSTPEALVRYANELNTAYAEDPNRVNLLLGEALTACRAMRESVESSE